ncbi:MAG: PilZ domain-containing protein [Nitrospirota bacterium]
MHRRAFERVPVNITVRFCCGNDDCNGTVSDLSEKGMFICTENMCFPFNSEFKLAFPLGDEILNLSVKVRRITKTADRYDGIGIELLSLPKGYLDYIETLRQNG